MQLIVAGENMKVDISLAKRAMRLVFFLALGATWRGFDGDVWVGGLGDSLVVEDLRVHHCAHAFGERH